MNSISATCSAGAALRAFAVVGIAMSCAVARAQTSSAAQDHASLGREASAGVSIGAAVPEMHALDARLASRGYSRLPSGGVALGVSVENILPSGWVLGGRAYDVKLDDGHGPNNLRTSFRAGYVVAEAGYAFVRTRSILLTGLAQLGGYEWGLGVAENQGGRFDDLISNPPRSVKVNRTGLLGGLALAFDVRFGRGANPASTPTFYAIGARVGALYGPSWLSWDSSDSDVSGAPKQGFSGGYAELTFQIGLGR